MAIDMELGTQVALLQQGVVQSGDGSAQIYVVAGALGGTMVFLGLLVLILALAVARWGEDRATGE
jgi:hypothetical protein